MHVVSTACDVDRLRRMCAQLGYRHHVIALAPRQDHTRSRTRYERIKWRARDCEGSRILRKLPTLLALHDAAREPLIVRRDAGIEAGHASIARPCFLRRRIRARRASCEFARALQVRFRPCDLRSDAENARDLDPE